MAHQEMCHLPLAARPGICMTHLSTRCKPRSQFSAGEVVLGKAFVTQLEEMGGRDLREALEDEGGKIRVCPNPRP